MSRENSQPSTPYGTFPRSRQTTPSSSTQATPLRAKSSFQSSPKQIPGTSSAPSRPSLPPNLIRGASFGSANVTGTGGGVLGTGRYRNEEERARKEGNPESWMVLGAVMQTPTMDLDSFLSSPPSGGGDPQQAGDIAGGSRFSIRKRKVSTAANSTLSGKQSTLSASLQRNASGNDPNKPSPSSPALFSAEPTSYATINTHATHSPNPGENANLLEADGDIGYVSDDDHSHSRQRLASGGGAPNHSDSESSDSDDETPPANRAYKPKPPTSTAPPLSTRLTRLVFPLSPVTKNVIKCVVAYMVAELFTFNEILSDLVGAPFDVDGPVRNAHVIATVAVYFNPARTIGSMIEADLYMLIGTLYSVFLCCGSMAFTVLLDSYGYEKVAHAIVLIFWLGGGFGVLAYVKAKVNKPTLTTACSLVSLISSVIITKEGAYHIGKFDSQAILQTTTIVLIGTLISNIVCFILWPGSATSKLQIDLNKTLNSFSTLLEMLTKTFLLDEETTKGPEQVKKAIDAHQSSFTTLKSSLDQARYEIFDFRIRATTQQYEEAVLAMTRLAQGLTGLRAGLTLQWDIMNAKREGKLGFGTEGNGNGNGKKEGEGMVDLADEMIVLEKFRERVGTSLTQLTWTSKQTLSLLRTSFVNTKAGSATLEAIKTKDDEEAALTSDALISLKKDLEASLLVFKREHSQAIKILYQRLPEKTVYGDSNDPFIDLDLKLGAEPLKRKDKGKRDDGPNDNLFRIYYFCFNLEEWAYDLLSLIDTFVDIRSTEEAVARRNLALRKRWGFLTPIRRLFGGKSMRRRRPSVTQRVMNVRDTFSGLMVHPQSKLHSPFPKIVDGAVRAHQVPASELSFLGNLKQRFWRFGWHLRQPNVKFAVKTGLGVAILASPAFIPSLRYLWLRWRGEWALISYMVVMAPTIGGTNFLALGRVLGTVLGASAAVAFYEAFPENAVVLPILGGLFSVPCFWIIVTRPQYGPSSRFVLLTFNLTCLYAYNLREADTHVISIAYHRSIAVAVGVVWGLIVTLYVWPSHARNELRKGLSDFFINAAYLYERLVRTYSVPPQSLRPTKPTASFGDDVGETTGLLSTEGVEELEDFREDFLGMEVYLQISLIKLSGLLGTTAHEPRLKGPFPVATYRTILASCQSILDLLSSMRTVTTREAWYTIVRRDFVIPVNPERREMVGNVLLYLSILASAISLKAPLPAYLPPAAEARNRLVKRLRELPVVQRRIVRGGSSNLLYLAYALTMKDVIIQLELLGRIFQHLFGIIGGEESTEAFEALFVTYDEEDGLYTPGTDTGTGTGTRTSPEDSSDED